MNSFLSCDACSTESTTEFGKNARPKVCYYRGSYLNPFEAQYLEPLQEEFNLTVAHSKSYRYDVRSIRMRRMEVSCFDYLNGIIPRRIAGRNIPNLFKWLGYEDVVFGLAERLTDYSLVHVAEQTFYSSWQVAARKRRLGYKLVTTQDEVNPYWYLHKSTIADRVDFVRRQTDLFIARTQRAKSALVCEGVDPNRIRIVGHGVDLERFHPGSRNVRLCKELSIDPGRFIILFVGQLVWTKGIFALANAVKLLMMDPAIKQLDPLFLMVGQGDEKVALEEMLKLLGIDRSFVLLGNRPYHELPDLHRLADIFVLPSISTRYILEQFGIALIESMACGKPVVSTHCGSIDEVVGDAGILVQPNDYYELCGSLRSLCRDAELRQELGERALARVQDKFSHKVIASSLASAYWDALSR